MSESIENNFKRVIYGILPIIILVLILSFIFKIDTRTVIRFLSSSLMVIIGLTLFTTGADVSLNVIGEMLSRSLIKKKNLTLILIVCLFLGTFITMLEPEFLTVATEANGIPLPVLLFFVSLGIGIFLMLAIFRILKRIDFKAILISGYLLIFLLLLISNFEVVPFAFDMASVTTGAISAPFILAFGVGFASHMKRKSNKDSEFGILSICSLGPIVMVLLLGIFFHPNVIYDSDPILKKLDFLGTLWMNFYQVFLSLTPLVVMFLIFYHFKKRKRKTELRKIVLGLLMVLVGITLFLTGGDVGFFKIGYMLGTHLGTTNHVIIMLIGGIFGYFIAKIEPSLKVLISYVNDVTNGGIKDKFLEICLCLGVSISVIVSLFRVLYGYPVMEFLIPIYFLAILFAFFTPNNFLSIAFDALGVVAGNMTSSFLLPLLIGVASLNGGNFLEEAFGIISLISIIPVVILEIVGLIYNVEEKVMDTSMLDDTIIDYRC